MPDFSNVGRRFRSRMRTLNGQHVYGVISPVPEAQGRGNQFFIPRRMLNVHAQADFVEGTIVLDASGRKMLAAWGGEDEFHGVYSRSYKLYDLDRSVSWTRSVTVEDAVTGLEMETETAELGPIWCAMELAGQESDMLKVSVTKYRLLCAAALQAGDRIDGQYTVQVVNRALGITVAEVW